MKISASIYSNKEKDLETLVRELDVHGIDMFHIDCFDDAVFKDIARIRAISKTSIDLHIIHPHPESFFTLIDQYKVDFVSVQYNPEIKGDFFRPNGVTLWGLAITLKDSLAAVGSILQQADFALIMASEPGVSGKPFDRANFQRITDFKQQFPQKKVQVDGGVNDRIAFVLRLLGVNSIVSGNYLMKGEYLGVGMLNLHKTPSLQEAENDFKMGDFMTPCQYLPVLTESDLTIKTALETIEKFRMGFVLVNDAAGKLKGVISNADIRRGFLNKLNDLNAVEVSTMINRAPVVIGEDETLTDMLHLLNNLNFIILFLPVVGRDNQLKGAVLLNNLTRV
jgi:pentose-5-phosphate-3-epimerase/CBS domain-containing protein